MPEFFYWQPSERYGELRNDGRSIHHRNELEKAFAVVAVKLYMLREESFESGTQAVTDAEQRPGFQSRNFQIGGA